MLNYKFLVLGFVIVGLLFVPPSIPYMIPIAEASPMDNPADAINDLSLSSISKYSNQNDRNSITLSWSAPNDNGSPILFYNIQVHEISGNGWTVLENDVYGTTYTHENAPTPYQFSYRVFAIAADGCNGSSSTFYNACNESNILHVVSLPNAESGAVNPSCNNSDLDDCGYFDVDTTPPVITVPSDQTFTTTDPAGYVYDFSVSATDNVAIDTTRTSNAGPGIYCTHIELTHPIPPGTLFPVGTGDTNHVFCHATDTSGNTAQATFIVTVIYEAADTTPPENDSSPATGPFTITDDSTGGDCSTIGTWSSASKTCTLNTDVATTGNNHGISIASSDIILDGAGHTVSGDNWNDLEGNSGVYVGDSLTTGFVIKNFNIEGFHNGIKAYGTQSGTITGNTVSSPDTIAINAYGARSLKITDNTISNSHTGILMYNVNGNKECSGDGSFVVSGNNVGTMGSAGMRSLFADGICFSNNTLESYFSVESNSKDVIIKNNQLTGSGNGFDIGSSFILSMTNNTANSNLYNGFRFTDSNVVTMTGNTANSNSMNGFTFNENSYASVFTDNTATGNTLNNFDGISEVSSDGAVDVDSLSIGQHATKNGGDCDSVGTWVPSPTGFDVGGTCTLTKDIQITGTGVGITIASSGVTLDGAGHTVTGTHTAGYDHVGVKTCNQCYHMAIKNLEITNFAYGIFSNYAHGLIITGVTVTDVGKTAMSLGGSSRLIVDGNTIDVNIPNSWYGGINIHTNNAYAHLANGSCETTDSMYSTNMIMVPWEWREGLVVIKNNVINGAALSISEQDGYCIDGNTISDSPGMLVSNSNNNMIKNNVITAGDLRTASSGSTFDSNTVTGGSIGFHNTGTANIFTNNIANDNSQHGFKFEPDTPPLTFTDNVATGNGVSDIEGYAVAVDDPFSNVDLEFAVLPGICNIYTIPSGLPNFTPGDGRGIHVHCDVANTGEGLATDLDVNIVVLNPDGTVYAEQLVMDGSNLASNTSVSWYKYDWGMDMTLGTYTYTLTIDPENKVSETNESNNVITGSFEVVPFVDLPIDLEFAVLPGICNIYTIPSGLPNFTPGDGRGIHVHCDVANTGEGLATDLDVNIVVLNPDGTVYAEQLVMDGSNLASNTSVSWYKYDWGMDMTLGTYTYTLTIDPENKVSETNESNNVITGSFEVVPFVDLPIDLEFAVLPGICNIYTIPSGLPNFTPGDGRGIHVHCDVANTGEGLATDLDVNIVVLNPDGTVYAEQLVMDGSNLASNTSVSWYKYDWGMDMTLGTYTYTLTIDPENKVSETNESNNVITGSFEVVEYQQTCFTAAGYSAPWTSDPDTSSRDVQINGKLTPKQNGECLSSDAFSLEGQSVLVTATKNGVTKTATGTTFNVGLFNSFISFSDKSDEGTWDVTFTFEGQDLYLSTTEFINGMESFTIVIPAPPPNPIPIVNTPTDITLYTGTPSFSFAQSTINYNLYSGNTGPVFYPQPTASITGVSSEIVTFDVTATDNDLSSGPTCDVTSGSEFSVGTTTVTCSATDSDGGVGTASFDVTVIEQTISGSPTCTPGSNSQFQIGSTQVSCSVTDGQGNASTDTFAVNVQPKSPLSDSQCRAAAGSGHDSDSVFVCEYPFHETVEEGQRLVWVDTQPWQGFYHHSLTSNNYLFDHTDAGVMDMLPSAWGGVGVYSFYDKLNTVLSGSITIAESDTTAPNVNVPNDLVISTEDQNGTPIVTYSVSASDDREVVSGPTCDVQSGSTFSIGTTKVTCTASDAAGNTGTNTFDVTVEYTYIDTTPPGFAAYDNISRATTNPAGTVVTYTLPTVTDNIGVTSGPTCDLPSGSVFPIGTTEVTCDASDAAGNPASISFNVVMTKTYVDDTAPAVYITFGETSDEIAVAADSSSGKELGFTVNAIDNVGVTVGPTCSDAGFNLGVTPSGDAGYYAIDSKMYPIGVSIVVCTASDAAGNMGSSTFAVTVSEYSAPTAPFTILDDSTGGDCQHIGTWNAASKTCTITDLFSGGGTGDIESTSDGIIIGSDGITLQGDAVYPADNTPKVDIFGPASGTNYGIKIDGKSNITIKNILLKNFETTLFANNVDTLTLENIFAAGGYQTQKFEINNSQHVVLHDFYPNTSDLYINNSDDVEISGADDNIWGNYRSGWNNIRIDDSHDVEIKFMHLSGSAYYGSGTLFVTGSSSNVDIHDSTIGAIQVYNEAYSQKGVGSDIIIRNNIIRENLGLSGAFASGPFVIKENTFPAVTSYYSGTRITIGDYGSGQYRNDYGVGQHVIKDNLFQGPSAEVQRTAISLNGNSGSEISGNTFSDIWTAINLRGSQNNQIFNNNFILTTFPVSLENSINVVPDPQPPLRSSGNNLHDNYWTIFDEGPEGCYNDSPFDNNCDSSYLMTPEFYWPYACNGACKAERTESISFLTPWVMQNGEMPSTPIESPPDNIFPTITVPSSQTIQTVDQSGIIVNYGTVTATDDRTVTSGPTCDVESGTLFIVGDTVVTCTASDAADNVSTSSFTITVVFSELDTTPPIVLTPDNIIVVTTGSETTVSFVNGTATDNVGVTSGPNCNPSSGSLFSVGNSTVVCSASDAAGNTGSASFTITVEESIFADTNTFEPGVSFAPGKDFSELGVQTFEGTATFGEFTEFAKSQEFSNSMTFEKYQHFEDSTDFTAISQTFKEGTTFGDGTTFRSDGTQSLPVGTIPSFGVMLEEFSCVTADCKPTDTSKFLSPGDFLPSGIDPAASFSRITSADKSLTIDGLGLVMTFDTVYGDGTIKADLYDPANIPSSTDAGSGKVSVITNTSESISTIGSVIDLSAGTATVSGSITITMPYLESNVPAGTAESDLVVLHYTNNQWVTESNCTVDTVNNKITCTVTELSPFGIGSRSVTQTSEDEITLDVDDTPPEFEEVNNILVDATTSNGATVTYEIPMATDDGGITDTPVCEPESGSFFPIGTTPVTCTVKDIAGIQGATVFLVTVKSLIAAPVEIPNNVSITIGKSDYNTKEAIFVSGVAAPFTEDKVSINVQDQSDNLVLVEQITPESSGVYTGIIFPNSLWSTSGNYTMSATYGTATDSTPFTFEFLQTEIDNSNIPTGITLNTNATGYALGDVISVKSQLTGGTSGQSIIIDVKDESGDNVVLQSLNTDDSGSTSLNFKAQDTWIPGTYNVTARDGSALWDYSTSKSIQLVRPLPEITISPTITTTESGDVITSYKAGEIGYFSTALLSESTSNVLVTINVLDSEGATLGVAFFKSIIGKGDSEIVLGFKIPEDAADGAAKIYVNTYTDWIDQGGIVISSELLSEVNIEGVISVENISDDGTVLVIPKSGSSVPGCEQSIQGCYLPNPTIINVGDTVSFSNTDTTTHTFTSGSPSNGPNGIFDSSVLMSGEKYEFTFEDEGQYDYFDMIRPWMAGTIVVGNSESYTTLPENIIPKFSDISDITQSASSSVGNAISYPLPIAIGGVITSGTTCTPAPGSMFTIGSTQVTCTATNEVGNTGMTSFMVTINPIPQTADQSLSVKVGKDLYNNLEPLFVTGSVGKITGDSINLEVYDELNHLISIEQTTPKESGVYNTIITSNELWSNSGEYIIIAKYDSASAQDTFEFELIEVEEIISEQIPTELYVSTDNSVYILGDDVFIDMQLVDAGAGEPILLEVRDSQNDQVLLQSLNTDSDGNADISYQLESTHDSGIYSVIVTSANWDFITTETFVAVAQIPDIIVGDVVPTLQDGTEVDSFEVGDIGYFQTPIISNSTSNVLIAVNIFDVENTPLGLAYFNSKVVDDTFDIVLGLQIPENVTPGLATVYINTYTDWADEGGVPILEEQVSFIEISPSSVSDLTLSTNPTSTNSTETVP